MVDIYIEKLITANSFLQFTIGSQLDLSLFKVEEDYNPIRVGGVAYYFFNQEIDVEVFTKDGLIKSFDILIRNQGNQLFLGDKHARPFSLRNCTADNLSAYLNDNDLNYETKTFEQVISVTYFGILKLTFYFDINSQKSTSLTLFSISKVE